MRVSYTTSGSLCTMKLKEHSPPKSAQTSEKHLTPNFAADLREGGVLEKVSPSAVFSEINLPLGALHCLPSRVWHHDWVPSSWERVGCPYVWRALSPRSKNLWQRTPQRLNKRMAQERQSKLHSVGLQTWIG